MSTKTIDGLDILVERRSVRHCRIQLTGPDAPVRVIVPRRARDDEIEALVRKHRAWIDTHLRLLREVPPLREHAYVTGELVAVWGKAYPLRVEAPEAAPNGESVRLADGVVHLYAPPDASVEQKAALLERWYRAQTRAAVAERLPYWEKRVGVKVEAWSVHQARTRWGSCNRARGRVNFSLQLAKHSKACLELVIAHELCHFWEANHGEKFYRHLSAVCPDWREWKSLLESNVTGFRGD